ncbi:vWA domain-containing protein [Paludifilum halophilum]|uniref:vWA domain-containing protein n=1 Tax=Paludifilum halophilum TaxID=1642702 RepID=UPI00146B702F|nr:VWA domain-containing protein [Paludifilum halophilum]
MKIQSLFSLTLCLFLLVACTEQNTQSSNEESPEKPTAKKEEKIPEASDDPEEIMRQNPGKFSGENYDEEKVEKALDQLPDDMTSDEAYNHLVYLLGEDYQKEYQKLLAFDTTLQIDVDTPEEGEEPAIGFEQLNVAIVLDASGSMAGKVDGGMKMDLAKEAVQNFVSELPEGAQVSLRVYGHKGSNSEKDKEVSCKSNEVVYPMGDYAPASFKKALNRFQPTGWTPLTDAIEEAHNDLNKTKQGNVRNVVYVVSDGEETCGGDPVQAGKELHESNIQPVVNIVGFDVDDKGQQQLLEVAEAADGTYKDVYSESDLQSYLEAEKEQLRLEWHFWGADSENKIMDRWAEKFGLLEDIIYNEGLWPITDREIKHLYAAEEYLSSKGKVEDDHKLGSLIFNREKVLGSFYSDKNSEINESLKKERKRLKEQVREKKEEMVDEYE